MYSRQEASRLKKEFWTVFGQYMMPVLSADGEKINWINYKTGEKYIFFKMHADHKNASVCIELHHSDSGIRQLVFEQFQQFRNIFQQNFKEEWKWQPDIQNETGKTISKICLEKTVINIFNKEDWPILISFFKETIIGLDEFWSSAKYAFETLR